MLAKGRLSVSAMGLGIMLFGTALGSAQVTGSGTSGTVPVFTSTGVPATVGNSPISVAGGNVGIGTTSPGAPLQVVGTGWVVSLGEASNSSGHQLLLGVNNSGVGYGSIQSLFEGTAYTPLILNSNGGNVGIGTSAPQALMHVFSSAANSYNLASWDQGVPASTGTSYVAHRLTSSSVGINGWGGEIAGFITEGVGGGLTLSTVNNSAPVEAMRINYNGKVGIGTTIPGEKLEVSGNIKLGGTGSHITFPDSSTQSTAWTGVLCGGDYAESVDVSGDRNHYEPGDVLIIDPDSPSGFTKTAQTYSTAVAGVYSTKPGVIGRKSTNSEKAKTEIPMAMVGIVPTKVSAENGSIKRGDLLVTSTRLGYAMKGTDRTQISGAIVGKALEPMASGSGMIDVLISLQ